MLDAGRVSDYSVCEGLQLKHVSETELFVLSFCFKSGTYLLGTGVGSEQDCVAVSDSLKLLGVTLDRTVNFDVLLLLLLFTGIHRFI